MITSKTPLTNKYFAGSGFFVCTATNLSLLLFYRKNTCADEVILVSFYCLLFYLKKLHLFLQI